MSFPNAHMLVDADWLAEHLQDEKLRIVDCAWDVAAYGRAHIPGAIARPGHPYIKAKDAEGANTVHIADADAVRAMCREMGIGPHTDVVVYDDWGTLFATRLWWVLRCYGLERVRVLNGGWQGWVAAGHPVSFAAVTVPDVPLLELVVDPARIISLEELRDRYQDDDLQILDVRSDEEYRGLEARGNKRQGRIPGALHQEWNRLLENSRDAKAVRSLRSEEEVRVLIEEAGLDPEKTVVTHCQAAIRATYTAFVLELMGFPSVRVYDGSMEEWANRDDTPLE